MSEPVRGDKGIPAWLLPVIIAGIAFSIVGGFYLGGPGLGMAVGALDAAAVVVLAVREPPLGPIAPAAPQDSRRHVLVVLERPLGDDVAASEAVARAIRHEGLRADGGGAPDVLLLVPCRTRFLDRWASDLDGSRHRAQRDLVLSAAALAAAGVDARARAGDEDVVQMVEDELRTFPATEVIYVGGAPGKGPARALDERMLVPMRQLAEGDGALEQDRVHKGLRQIAP